MIKHITSVLLMLLLRQNMEVSSKPTCESGRFEVNGICLQQFYFCPLKSIYLNDICFPVSTGNCTPGTVFVNDACCTESCMRKCEETASCDCCGNSAQNITKPSTECTHKIIPPCGYAVLPCLNKPTSAPETVKCPEGTKSVLGNCRLIHCSNGVYKDGRCVRFACPSNTLWNGKQCEKIAVNHYQISFNNSYISTVKVEPKDVYEWSDIEKDDLQHIDEIYEDKTQTTTALADERPATWEEIFAEDKPNNTNCCDIVSPRICQIDPVSNKWHCFNRRHEFCGDICTRKTICLLPARSRQCATFIVVAPPPKNTAIPAHTLDDPTRIDCSGCVSGNYTKCSKYCYYYAPCSDLNPIDCLSLQQHEFCANNSGMVGCLQADGYYDSLPNFA